LLVHLGLLAVQQQMVAQVPIKELHKLEYVYLAVLVVALLEPQVMVVRVAIKLPLMLGVSQLLQEVLLVPEPVATAMPVYGGNTPMTNECLTLAVLVALDQHLILQLLVATGVTVVMAREAVEAVLY
jgi:hypothetical protein